MKILLGGGLLAAGGAGGRRNKDRGVVACMRYGRDPVIQSDKRNGDFFQDGYDFGRQRYDLAGFGIKSMSFFHLDGFGRSVRQGDGKPNRMLQRPAGTIGSNAAQGAAHTGDAVRDL